MVCACLPSSLPYGMVCCCVPRCPWCLQVAGSLAQRQAKAGAQLQGVLVRQGGKHTVVAAQDLPNFTSLHPGRILQRQILSLHKSFSEVIICQILRQLMCARDVTPLLQQTLLMVVRLGPSPSMWLASCWQGHVQSAAIGALFAVLAAYRVLPRLTWSRRCPGCDAGAACSGDHL